jgi:hypothetical protein
MRDAPDKDIPPNLRGWLSEVYVTAALTAQSEHLARRLGARSTVDDPIFGRAKGMPKLAEFLRDISEWFRNRDAAFDKTAFTLGPDSDVTEGTMTLTLDGRRVPIPVAIVAERRRGREIEMRLYYSTQPIRATAPARPRLHPDAQGIAVPPPVAAHIDALARGDVDAAVAAFESRGALRDSAGVVHIRDNGGGPLRVWHEKQLRSRPGSAERGSYEIVKGARTDDGRTCALEYTVVRVHGADVVPQPGLAIYERGESGLLSAVRMYDDVRA